jgi:hypothetical protein
MILIIIKLIIMRTTFGLKIFACCALMASIISCKKQDSLMNRKSESPATFPTTQKEKQTVAVLKEVGDILKSVYRKPEARAEAIAAIKTEYYVDERVLLKDLLFPESSPLYNTDKFRQSRADKGVFKKYFFETFEKGNYPNLKAAMKLNNYNTRETAPVPVDSTNEIWTDENGVSIYFPYSENFPYIDPLDPNNNRETGNLITIVIADREADSGPGQEPYYSTPDPQGFNCPDNICYTEIMVNDDYADGRATNIVGVGAEPTRMMPDPTPPSANVNRVFHGWSCLTDQRDAFISLSGNGGGSEIKIARISGYLQFENQQVTNFAGDAVSVSYTRKEIRKKKWKRVYTVWDPNWVADNFEQVYAIWEEDNEGTKTFNGSLSTTATIPVSGGPTITAARTLSYGITVKTQDELVTQRKISRIAYFGAAKTDQGWGFNLCDKGSSPCRYDNTFLSTGYWPAYDGNGNAGAIWNYTWPYNSY